MTVDEVDITFNDVMYFISSITGSSMFHRTDTIMPKTNNNKLYWALEF